MPATMNGRPITTIPQLLAVFGGTSALGRAIGRSPPAVSQWQTHVPCELYLVVRRAARRRGFSVSNRLFNFDRPTRR
jgi:hypothetical protein